VELRKFLTEEKCRETAIPDNVNELIEYLNNNKQNQELLKLRRIKEFKEKHQDVKIIDPEDGMFLIATGELAAPRTCVFSNAFGSSIKISDITSDFISNFSTKHKDANICDLHPLKLYETYAKHLNRHNEFIYLLNLIDGTEARVNVTDIKTTLSDFGTPIENIEKIMKLLPDTIFHNDYESLNAHNEYQKEISLEAIKKCAATANCTPQCNLTTEQSLNFLSISDKIQDCERGVYALSDEEYVSSGAQSTEFFLHTMFNDLFHAA